MGGPVATELIFGLMIIVFVVILILYRKVSMDNQKLRLELKQISFAKQSLSSRYGKLTEQFIPFLKVFPYDEHNFRFLGNPIDGVQFEDDKIIFMEFKTADSQMTSKQKRIKELVEKKKVSFEEIKLK
jgi:predicted Holliday junction resolvase-like endonuclease